MKSPQEQIVFFQLPSFKYNKKHSVYNTIEVKSIYKFNMFVYIICITVCIMPLKDLHFYEFLIIKFYVAQVLHDQICLIPKDRYVSVIIL